VGPSGERRNFARTAGPGVVLRTGFGETGFVTENPLSASRFAYEADPPPELRRSWAAMIDYYDFVERSARELLQQREYEDVLSDDEDARISVARSRIEDFAVERCGASRAPSDP
jgi:hypothetical protein